MIGGTSHLSAACKQVSKPSGEAKARDRPDEHPKQATGEPRAPELL